MVTGIVYDCVLYLWLQVLCVIGRLVNIFPLSFILNYFREHKITKRMQCIMVFSGKSPFHQNRTCQHGRQVRSGMAAYGGAARRRVHLATVLLRPPSGQRPGRRQARHTHILQIGLRLAIAQADARPAMPVSFR